MAGTIEGIALCLMNITVMVFVAVKTGDVAFWCVAAIGAIAVGAHVAIMFRNRNAKSESEPTTHTQRTTE